MEHLPTTESDVEKVYRIARELGVGLEEAADTCDAFHLAFSDEGMRRAIFEIVDQLDESAAKKGEPLGLIIRYAVELGQDGIWVGRYADEIPLGEVVELTPPDRAVILLKIKDNFPTQEFLGPLIVNRPGWHFDTFDPNAEIPEDLSHPEPARVTICLGPISLTFNERFPFISAAGSSPQPAALQAGMPALQSKALNSNRHLPQWAALQARVPAVRWTSGLSPPRPSENVGHSERKRCPSGPW